MPRNARISPAISSPFVSRAKWPASSRWYSSVFRSRLYGSAPAAGAEPYRRDLKNIDFHLIDAGHFALETNGAEIVGLMRDFLGKHLRGE